MFHLHDTMALKLSPTTIRIQHVVKSTKALSRAVLLGPHLLGLACGLGSVHPTHLAGDFVYLPESGACVSPNALAFPSSSPDVKETDFSCLVWHKC